MNIDGHTVTGNKARLSKDGRTLIVKLNNNDPNLTGSGDVHFWIKIGAKFDANKNGQEIKFGASTNKTLHIDNSSSVSINKTHSDYDSNKNELTYTVEVTSKGANQKVQVTDALSGEILKFKEIKSITSNKRDNLSQDVTPSKNGFQYAIGDMVHDEVVTITYTAEVDYSKIPANGTVSVDNKKNTASVIVDGEKKEEKTDTYDKDINNKISISKSMTGATENGVVTDPSNIPWKLVVNESKRASMSGKTITDTIDPNSQAYMHYTGSGITIKVSTGEVRSIPWSKLNLATDSNGNIISWSYTAPESDGNVSYEISYATAADNASFYDKTDLKNNASVDGGGSGSATAPVGPNEGNKGAAIAKKGKLNSDRTKISWTITVTVPAKGIPGATIVDSLPCSDPYLDTYDGEGITVKYLDADETHTDTLSQDGKTITIEFSYRDTDGTTKYGLKGTGEKRTLEITYSTDVDPEWAQTDEAWRYGHTNTAKLTGPNITASDTVHVTKTSLSKSGQCNGTVNVGGVDYPKFDFTLTFKGDVTDGDEVTDTFPTEYFKVYEEPRWDGSTPYRIAGGHQYHQGDETGGVVSVKGTETGAQFTVSSYPRNENGEYYAYYKLTYTLIPKDENALKELQKLALADPNHTYKLHNEASWGGAANQVDVAYTCKPLTKSDAFEYSTNKVHFTIKANEAGLKLNGGESLTLTDTMSTTLRYDASSLVVKAGGEDITQKVVPNENNGTLTITGIPDEKVIEITYDARVLGSGQVTYSNRAELTGCGDGINISKTVTLNGSAGGGGSRLGIKIRKYKAGDQSSKLAGAVFQLYKLDDNGHRVPVTDKNDNIVTCTTNDDGNAELQTDMDKNGWAFVKNRTYYLVEITAPEGYQLDSTPIEFKFVDSPSASNEYYSGDTIYVANEEKNEGHLVITKTINANGVAADKVKDIKNRLRFTVKNNTTNEENPYTLNDFAEDNGVWKLELDTVAGGYTVTETVTDVTGVVLRSVSYTIDGGAAVAGKVATVDVKKNQTTTVAFTNTYEQKLGNVEVTKVFSGVKGLPDGFQITNDYNEDVFTLENASGEGTAENPYKWTIKNVPDETEITFTESGYDVTGYDVTINGQATTDAETGTVKATIAENETAIAKFTNEYTPTKRDIEISKVDLTDNKELEGASLQITGTDIDGKEITPIKWTSGDDGKNEDGTVKTHTVKLTAGTYTLSETAAPDGYKIAASIKFMIDKEGKVTSDTKDAVTGNKVTMKDEKKDTSASISVTKNLKTVAGENIYAVDQTFYVALYEDENCTKLASEIKALTFKNSTSETVTFEGVEPNKTYYVGECTKDGVRYLSGVVAGTKYVAQFTDGNSVTVETPNGSKAVYFDNRFMKFPDGFYKEGVLSITKLFKDKTGKAKNSDETFYAGIFDDEECTKLSENVAQNIIPLNLNGSSSVTAQIKVSIAQGTSKTFYVTEVDKDGKPINEETFKYDVSVENGEVTFDENNTSAEVTITNQEQDEDKDKDKDKDKGKTTTTSSNATTTKAVKTGDNTPIGIFVILLIAAIVVIGGGIYLKRRKK